MAIILGDPRHNPAVAYPELRDRPMPPELRELLPVELPAISSTLRGWQCMSGESKAAPAGQQAHVQLFNPTGSGQRIIVDTMIVSSSVTQNLLLLKTDLQAVDFVRPWIRLQAGLYRALGEIRTESTATPLGGRILSVLQVSASIPFRFDEIGAILDEGDGLLIRTLTAGSNCAATFIGRELDAATWGVG